MSTTFAKLVAGVAAGPRALAGSKVVIMGETGSRSESEVEAKLEAVLSDTYLRLDYQWSYEDRPQSGTLLVGSEADGNATAAWADTWHTNRKIMHFTGKAVAATDGKGEHIDLLGSWEVPGHGTWGWRIELSQGEGLDLMMFIITPDGAEGPAVELRLGA